MATFPTDLVVILMCWSLPLTTSTAGDFSNYTLNFLALYRGDFDNQNQTNEPSNENPLLQLRLFPVNIAALNPAPVVYTEFALDGDVLLRGILIVSEHPGPSIYVDIYYFPNPSSYKFGEFNVSTLHDLTQEDLGVSNGTAIYKKLSNTVYVGYYPDTSSLINGNHPNYGETFTCNAYGVSFPPTDPGIISTPFILHLVGDRHPLIGFPDNFDSICGKNVYHKKPRPKYG